MMKAFVKRKYGGPEILKLKDIETPTIKENSLLIQVKANSVNPADWHILRGKPLLARLTLGIVKPKQQVLGVDFAGKVIELGKKVTKFKVGDKVFGESLNGGAFAEYIAVPETECELIPNPISFEEMACVPVAGLTALQALITHGKLKKGESVLLNGSSGGVGHFAVQIAKAYGAEVTAICSNRNIDFVKSLGADNVIAYDSVDIHQYSEKFDLVIDINGNLHYSDYVRMGKRGVMVGFTSVSHMVVVLLKKSFSSFPLIQLTAKANSNDLNTLAKLISEGKIKPHIEKRFSYTKTPEAISYIELMRTRGKVSLIWNK